jgi:hypothetical protein
MKNYDSLLKEFSSRLNDEDLGYLYSRSKELLCGDRADISNFVSQNKEVDRLFESAKNSDEFFDMIDRLGEFVKIEYQTRNK